MTNIVGTITGIFNIEGGCYAKCINLNKEKEPDIWNAIKFGSLLENVVVDLNSRIPDFNDNSITENTRVSYPIEYINNAVIPCVGTHPSNIILLTCDAFGLLPPVSKLDENQMMYYFVSGYTAKVAGTEDGIVGTCSNIFCMFWRGVSCIPPYGIRRPIVKKNEDCTNPMHGW